MQRLTESSHRAGFPEFEAGIALARQHGLEGHGRSLLATALSVVGEQASALVGLLEAQRLFQQAGLPTRIETTLLDIAIAYRRLGHFDQAMHYLRQSESLAEKRKNDVMLFEVLIQRGFLLYERGDYEASLCRCGVHWS